MCFFVRHLGEVWTPREAHRQTAPDEVNLNVGPEQCSFQICSAKTNLLRSNRGNNKMGSKLVVQDIPVKAVMYVANPEAELNPLDGGARGASEEVRRALCGEGTTQFTTRASETTLFFCFPCLITRNIPRSQVPVPLRRSRRSSISKSRMKSSVRLARVFLGIGSQNASGGGSIACNSALLSNMLRVLSRKWRESASTHSERRGQPSNVSERLTNSTVVKLAKISSRNRDRGGFGTTVINQATNSRMHLLKSGCVNGSRPGSFWLHVSRVTSSQTSERLQATSNIPSTDMSSAAGIHEHRCYVVRCMSTESISGTVAPVLLLGRSPQASAARVGGTLSAGTSCELPRFFWASLFLLLFVLHDIERQSGWSPARHRKQVRPSWHELEGFSARNFS